jgi:hypothetical protein
VVDAFPQHEGCILVGTFTSTAVVRHWSVLILVAVVIFRVVFAQTRLNLYENARIFVGVNAVIRPVITTIASTKPLFLENSKYRLKI